MKKKYEKPLIYSEQLAIDTLRAQCCTEASPTDTLDFMVQMGCAGEPCECWQTGGPS